MAESPKIAIPGIDSESIEDPNDGPGSKISPLTDQERRILAVKAKFTCQASVGPVKTRNIK
jgi:hypothetical protein